MENNKMNNYFNRFEWKKTVCRTIKELKKEFPLNNLIGKQIKSLNIIGSAEILYSWYLKRNEKTSESEKLNCSILANEPLVIVFDDNSTFEIQLLWERDYCFSENQIFPEIKDGINHCDIDANILFKELIGTSIKKIIINKEIMIICDSGYSLKIEFGDSNHSLISLCKENKIIQKSCFDCFNALIAIEQIEIQDRHNTSSYFWIEPATEQDSYEKGEFGVKYASAARISIEEDYVYYYLTYFLVKNYKSDNHKICRSQNNESFEWNLEPNLYKYCDIKKILTKIKEICSILKENFEDTRLVEWKKYSIGTNFIDEKFKNERIEYIKSHINMIIDFYERFCFQIEQMMKHYPEYECIDFMGP